MAPKRDIHEKCQGCGETVARLVEGGIAWNPSACKCLRMPDCPPSPPRTVSLHSANFIPASDSLADAVPLPVGCAMYGCKKTKQSPSTGVPTAGWYCDEHQPPTDAEKARILEAQLEVAQEALEELERFRCSVTMFCRVDSDDVQRIAREALAKMERLGD